MILIGHSTYGKHVKNTNYVLCHNG